MKIFRVTILVTVVAGLLFLAGCNCGQVTPPAQPAADTVAAAVPAEAEVTVLEQGEETDLQKLESAAPEYQPVTKDNYQQELASLEAEVAEDLK